MNFIGIFGQIIQGKKKKTKLKIRIKENVMLFMEYMKKSFYLNDKAHFQIANTKFSVHLCKKISRINEEQKSSQIRRFFT